VKLYESLANQLEASIRSGVLQTGERIPSVRRMSSSRGVSAATVFQAYYLLEARGLVRARERSGWFVANAGSRIPEPREVSAPVETGVEVQISDRVFDVLGAMMKRNIVPFGSALPAPGLYPLQRLGKSMAAAARTLTPWSTVDEMSPGKESLRRQIATRYAADGMTVHADDIVITNGALEALNLCLATVARPGDTVIVESPTFYAALQALERMGMRALEVPTHPCHGVELPALEAAIERHHPKACWLMPTFQNPLGCSMPLESKRQMVALLARHEVPLIEDDVYGELHFGERRVPPAKLFDEAGLVLHCSSFSKSLAPGYRVGWVAAGRFARAVARQKLSTTFTTSAPAQIGLASYLATGGYDRHLRKLRDTLAAQHAAMARAVSTHFPAGTLATRPEGGYFMWLVLPAGVDAMEVYRKALDRKVSVAPGPIFSASGQFRNCLRLNFGHPMEGRGHRALEQLGLCVRELEGTTMPSEGSR
jgi:DNA-binding transcriptional MocR family regulator